MARSTDTRFVAFDRRHVAAEWGATATHERHYRVRCACGGRVAGTVTFEVTNRYGWATVTGVDNPTDGLTVEPIEGTGRAKVVGRCPACGSDTKPVSVTGVYRPDRDCNDACMAATGPSCECSCGGANHGVSA